MIAPNPDAAGSKKPDVLTDIVARVLSAGANGFEVEYEDGQEQVCAMKGPVGFGIASLPSDSQEGTELREKLSALEKKQGKITVQGVDYVLRVEIFDSFGEDAFRVTITPA